MPKQKFIALAVEKESTPSRVAALYNPMKYKLLELGESQKEAIELIDEYPTFLLAGVAGTGKTFTAVKAAIDAYDRGEISKIYITRPPVEGGEKMGALPGTEEDKMAPYLRPIRDMIIHTMGRGELFEPDAIGETVVECATLNFMRGRTLNGYCIVDEAQNCQKPELYTLLTRLGSAPNSKMILTYDPKQCDLPQGPEGIRFTEAVLARVPLAGQFTLDPKQNYRHPVVAQIIDQWAEANKALLAQTNVPQLPEPQSPKRRNIISSLRTALQTAYSALCLKS